MDRFISSYNINLTQSSLDLWCNSLLRKLLKVSEVLWILHSSQHLKPYIKMCSLVRHFSLKGPVHREELDEHHTHPLKHLLECGHSLRVFRINIQKRSDAVEAINDTHIAMHVSLEVSLTELHVSTDAIEIQQSETGRGKAKHGLSKVLDDVLGARLRLAFFYGSFNRELDEFFMSGCFRFDWFTHN